MQVADFRPEISAFWFFKEMSDNEFHMRKIPIKTCGFLTPSPYEALLLNIVVLWATLNPPFPSHLFTSFMDDPIYKCNTVYNTAGSWIPLYNYWIGGHEMGVPLNDSHESSLFLRISITCNWLLVTESRDLFGFSPRGAIQKLCWQKFEGFWPPPLPPTLTRLLFKVVFWCCFITTTKS